MHTGFWSDLDDIRECSAEHGDITDPYELGFDFMVDEEKWGGLYSPFDFLHGCCDVFAKYLHERYGYHIEAIYGQYGEQLIHAYCVDVSGDTPIFLDIRGQTDNYEEFLDEFDLTERDLRWSDGEFVITGSLPKTLSEPVTRLLKASEWFDRRYDFWK